MTDEEMSMCIGLAETRLSRHGRATLRASKDVFSEPTGVTVVDGEPVILHYDRNNPTQITTYAIDKTMTMGQFIDTFNTTLVMMYGKPAQPKPLDWQIESVIAAKASQSPYVPSAPNRTLPLIAGEYDFGNKDIVSTCQRILSDKTASKSDKSMAAQALATMKTLFR